MIEIIIGINILAFVLQNISPLFYVSLLKINEKISEGEYYRLLTSNFLHGDIIHLGVNMYSLWAIGPYVANIPVFGSLGFALIYFLSAIASSFTSYMFNPNPSLGASGAIFGLVGALLVYSIKENAYGLTQMLLIIIAINVLIGFLPGVRLDNWGHLGGFVAGVIIATVIFVIKS